MAEEQQTSRQDERTGESEKHAQGGRPQTLFWDEGVDDGKKWGRCIIVGAGDFFGMPFQPAEEDYVIAADAGYENLKAVGIVPDLVVGDFDSMEVEGVKGVTGPVKDLDIFEDAEKAEYIHHLQRIELDGVETRIIDPIKNDPDMLACVRIGMELGYRSFHLIGGTGKRIDHSIANLQVLGFLAKQGMHGYLYGEHQLVRAIRNERVCFPKEMQGYFSALALSDECHGVTEHGFKYIVTDVTLSNRMPTGLSNEFVGTDAEISVTDGTLLLIYDWKK